MTDKQKADEKRRVEFDNKFKYHVEGGAILDEIFEYFQANYYHKSEATLNEECIRKDDLRRVIGRLDMRGKFGNNLRVISALLSGNTPQV